MINQGQGLLDVGDAQLHWQAFSPEQPIATLVLVHDLGEHGGCYAKLIQSLVDASIAVYAYDQRGHGRSTGVRGHVDSWAQPVTDLARFIEFAKQTEGDLPVFVWAQGFGALIAADCALRFREQTNGLILHSIAMQPTEKNNLWMSQLAKLMAMLWPQHQLNRQRYCKQGSQTLIDAVDAGRDPLVHQFVSVQATIEMTRCVERLRATAIDIKTPILLTHTLADQFNSVQGARQMHALVSSTDKKMLIYEQAQFDLQTDKVASDYAADVGDWLLPRASKISFERGGFYKMGSPDHDWIDEQSSVSSLAN
jgi:alpha-beta hydrolase superfamily lysophospholipase